MVFLFLSLYPVCEESPQLGVSRSYKRWSQMSMEVRMGWATHTSSQQYAHTRPRLELKWISQSSHWNGAQITKNAKRVRKDEVWMIKNSQSMLGVILHVPRGPFYSPKAARSRWEHSMKAILPFCRLAHRTVRCGFLSCSGAADRWRFGAVGAPDTVRCTPDSPVPQSDRWPGHASCADCAADRWLGWPLAHRTVRCTTRQSGEL
jgi:hypothetical protein